MMELNFFYNKKGEVLRGFSFLFLFIVATSLISASPFGYDIESTPSVNTYNVNVSIDNQLNQSDTAWLTALITAITGFQESITAPTTGAYVNSKDNHTLNDNNLIFAIQGNGSTGSYMPHFWIQNGASGQASGISRSFMIVNEQVSQQNTTNITSCANYADYAGQTLHIDCNTDVTGADLLVGDDAEIFGELHTSNIIVHGNVSIKRPYGSWSSTETQTITSPSTAFPISFNWTETSFQMTKEGNTNFSVQQNGSYMVVISAIFTTDAPNKHAELWLQSWSGSAWEHVPRSNSLIQIPSTSTEMILAVNFILPAYTSDKFRIAMASDDAGTQLLYTPATGYSPETPSIIMSATKVSELPGAI